MTNIKNQTVELNTGESASAKTIISINGFLEGVSLVADSSLNLHISLADIPEVVILNKLNCPLGAYWTLRTWLMAANGEQVVQQFDKWAINGQVRIVVNGSKNSKAKLVFKVS